MALYLVTGAAGFIGSKITEFLLKDGHQVVGIDNLNSYYDVNLKKNRLVPLLKNSNFIFHKIDIEDAREVEKLFSENHLFEAVLNIAAMAGVRYSIQAPMRYINTNVGGTLNLLECCKKYQINKFVLSSTSSLYAGQSLPFQEDLPVNTPISPYAASKKAAEVLTYPYHDLFGLDVTILRYFTVYGPAGRPDMSIFRFIKWIDEGRPLLLFGDGTQSRDFTFIDDIAKGTIAALQPVGYEIINLGSDDPHTINEAIGIIEEYLGKKARIEPREFEKTDMKSTWANIEKAKKILEWKPDVPFQEGLKWTVDWYLENKSWISTLKMDDTG